MAAEFLPMWAPDARAFQRATYMSSTDDVELLGTVKDGSSEEGDVLEHPASRSTTPFGKHSSKNTENPDATELVSPEEGLEESAPAEAEAIPAKEVPPVLAQQEESAGVSSDVSEALDMLEAEVEGPLDADAIEALEAEAFNRGRAAAMAEMASKLQSLKEENEQHAGVAEKLQPLVDQLDGLRHRLIRQSSEDVADMALHMARRVVGETLAVHPQALRKLVMDAIERLPGDDEITVRVRPDDLESVEQHLPTRRSVRVLADESLEGGCVVQAQCGEVSASIDSAFTGLRAAVDDWLEDQK